MTKEYEVYADALNLFGSDIPPQEVKEVREILDHEHGLADPRWLRGKQAQEASTLQG